MSASTQITESTGYEAEDETKSFLSEAKAETENLQIGPETGLESYNTDGGGYFCMTLPYFLIGSLGLHSVFHFVLDEKKSGGDIWHQNNEMISDSNLSTFRPHRHIMFGITGLQVVCNYFQQFYSYTNKHIHMGL